MVVPASPKEDERPVKQRGNPPALDSTFGFSSENASKSLDVPGAKPDDGAKIQQRELNGSPAQAWYIDPCGADDFRLIAVCSGRVLDIAGAGPPGT